MTSLDATGRNDLIAALQNQVRRLEGRQRPRDEAIVSTGCGELDRLFPENGLRRGSLIEWHGAGCGSGAASFALIAARQACAGGGALVVIDRRGWFYAGAAAALGIDLRRLILVRPATARDQCWAYDQSLKCAGVSAVWGHLESLDARSFRRLQLSAEEGGSLGLFVRPLQALAEPTWAEMRLLIHPRTTAHTAPRFRVEVVRTQGGVAGAAGEFEIDDREGVIRGAGTSNEASSLSVVSQLAHPAVAGRRS